MNLQGLENQIKRLEKKLKGIVIDMDDPNYAIYKLEESSELNKVMLDPVNKKAYDRESKIIIGYHKLIGVIWKEAFVQYYGDTTIKEMERFEKLTFETNKQIHIDDPHYLIYKFNPKAKSIKFEPYNKTAKDYEHIKDEYRYEPEKQQEMFRKMLESQRSNSSNKSENH